VRDWKRQRQKFTESEKTLSELKADLNRQRQKLTESEKILSELRQSIEDIGSRLAKLPKAIVLHPAVYGREIAWSAARVDFWFNDTGRLFRQASAVAGSQAIGDRMRDVLDRAKEGVGTWQFREDDGAIKLDETTDPPKLIVERTNASLPGTPNGRFSVSLFKRKQASGGFEESNLENMGDEESKIREPLDWLQSYHSDFWRLKDFSTSLMVLRYLKSKEIQLVSLSFDDRGMQVATPEWIYHLQVRPVVQLQ
jgi:hypothetical protein